MSQYRVWRGSPESTGGQLGAGRFLAIRAHGLCLRAGGGRGFSGYDGDFVSPTSLPPDWLSVGRMRKKHLCSVYGTYIGQLHTATGVVHILVGGGLMDKPPSLYQVMGPAGAGSIPTAM